MSKKDPNDVADDVRRASELDPIVDGVRRIGEFAQETEKKLTERIDESEKNFERGIDDLSQKLSTTAEDLADRIDRIRGTASFTVMPSGDGLNEVITEGTKKYSDSYERLSLSFRPDSPFADARTHMANADWFRLATRTQVGKGKNDPALHEARDKIFKALQEKAVEKFGPAAVQKATLAEETDNIGGYLVPTITEAEVQRLVIDHGQIFPIARQYAMTARTHSVPSESTACTVNWIDEGGALTQGEPNFGEINLIAEKLAGRATMSLELVQDSNVGLLSYLLTIFSEKMAGELDYQLVLGDGSSPKLTGIINASGINSLTSGTAAGRDITWSLLAQTFVGAGESSARDPGVWIMSPKGFAAVVGMTDTNGAPIVHYGTSVQGGASPPPMTILGRPLIVTNRLGGSATLDDTTNANTTIVFGPPSKLLLGTRAGMTWEVTDQVSWANYRADARLIGRYAGNVGVPAAFTRLTHINY